MRLNLGTLGPEYWTSSTLGQGSEVELAATARASLDGSSAGADGHDAQIVSNRSTCTTCGGQRFETYLEQRAHFATDVHKYNARRRAAGRPFVTVEEFEALAERQDAASLGSISASDDGNSSSDDATESESVAAREGRRAAAASVKVEFIDPVNTDKFILLYKAALPDLLSLASLAERGGWAVIMSGGGHFAASIWDKAGNVVKHKTFHRYTSRAKQGGSQAAADAQGGKRIKSAGATLRRHGEQQLQNEVRSLLASWRDALADVQCIYMRCNLRERRDLLVGWDGSPLASFAATGRLRNIPFPTRRATLKEVTRCYDELMTVVSATTSAVESLPVATKAVKPSTTAPKQTVPQEQPKEKGTAHLKKRVEKPSEPSVAVAALETARVTDEEPELELLPVEALVLTLLKACVGGDISTLQSLLDGDAPLCEKSVLFHRGYLKEVDALADLGDAELGLVGAATVTANMESINWLLDHGVPPNVGASPYVTTKSKAARTALRRYWGLHADSTLDFAGAGVPSPLTDADADAAAAKRRRERAKKKIRKDLREEEGKPADVRAREARAAAAELRLGIGASACALCRKSLTGKVPFERLTFKYCSTDCVSQHKERLAADAQKTRRS